MCVFFPPEGHIYCCLFREEIQPCPPTDADVKHKRSDPLLSLSLHISTPAGRQHPRQDSGAALMTVCTSRSDQHAFSRDGNSRLERVLLNAGGLDDKRPSKMPVEERPDVTTCVYSRVSGAQNPKQHRLLVNRHIWNNPSYFTFVDLRAGGKGAPKTIWRDRSLIKERSF